MNPIDWILQVFPNGKTYLAAAGLIGYGIYQLSHSDLSGIQSLMAGLAALGLRHALDKAVTPAT